MNAVEKNLTNNNIDLSKNSPEFQKRQESERKYLAVHPEAVEGFRTTALPIEQIYLSHPDEEFSLRVRAKYTPEGPRYTAALKDAGEIVDGNLQRLEVETEISEEAYQHYADQSYPTVKKLRAEPSPGLTIDFIEGLDTPLVEVEVHPSGSETFNALITHQMEEVTTDRRYHNESLAHALAGEVEYSPESLDTFASRAVGEMIALYSQGYEQVVVGVSGMSGSGKSSAVAEMSRQLQEILGESFKPSVLSTDDYHHGKKWLEETYGAPWTNWDDARVYNTAGLAEDLKRLRRGESVLKKHFDFDLEEVVEDDVLQPAQFTIVEGILAGSADLKDVRHLHFEVPTPPATSIGRDVRRLVLEGRANGSIGSPESRLRYQLETALPTYTSQERPKRNVFSASSRPLAQRAFALVQFTDWLKDQ